MRRVSFCTHEAHEGREGHEGDREGQEDREEHEEPTGRGVGSNSFRDKLMSEVD